MTEQVQENLLEIPFEQAGGMNCWDQADSLKKHSHAQAVDGTWSQVAPMESPDMRNIDFFQDGWGTRLGSTAANDLRSVLVASETLLDGFEWDDPNSGTRIIVILGAKAIYLNQSGSFAQAKHNNTAGQAFTFGTDVTKWTWVVGDGHLFLHVDGAQNPIHVYRNGAAMDDPLFNATATTTVNVDSANGQKVLKVAATGSFHHGVRVGINEGGARQEFGMVDTVQAGVSITLMDNLASTHTAVQADVVRVYDRYVEASATSVNNKVTGDWSLGNFLGDMVTERLTFSAGDTLVEYTPIARASNSGLWDLGGADAGAYFARARVVSINSFTPVGGDLNRALAHIFTAYGPGILTGFEEFDQAMDQNRQKGGVPLNNRCVVAAKNWLFYLTESNDIEAINGPTWVNVGRRLRAPDRTGPLDIFDVTQSRLTAFGFYDKANERIIFGVTTESGRVNDLQIVVDLRLDPAESLNESVVRLHHWTIANPDSNPWFNGMFQVLGSVVGITRDGRTWTAAGAGLPRTDMDSVGIDDSWQTLWFNGGATLFHQLFLNLIQRFKRVGGWTVEVDVLTDYADDAVATFSILQTASGSALYDSATYDASSYNQAGVVLKFTEVGRYAQAISFRVRNSVISHYWRMLQQNTQYLPGAMESQ